MRVLSLAVTGAALLGFAIAPASACEWMKSAKSNMTVVETVPETPDVSVATNDLAPEILEEVTTAPQPEEKPAE